MCTTDDDHLADRLRMIRNHAEAVVEDAGTQDLTNMLGFNLRLTELSAAVGRAQLAAVDSHVDRREAFATKLSADTTGLDGIQPPHVRPDCRHVYYVWAMRCDPGTIMPRTDLATLYPLTTLAADRKSSIRPLVQLPMKTRCTGIPNIG